MKKRNMAISVLALLVGILAGLLATSLMTVHETTQTLITMPAQVAYSTPPEVTLATIAKQPELVEVDATAYTWTGNPMKDGTYPYEGCVASNVYFGRTLIIYEDDGGNVGRCIGIYEVRDTGGHPDLRNGTRIDIYMDEYDECIQWGIRRVWIQIVEAEG